LVQVVQVEHTTLVLALLVVLIPYSLLSLRWVAVAVPATITQELVVLVVVVLEMVAVKALVLLEPLVKGIQEVMVIQVDLTTEQVGVVVQALLVGMEQLLSVEMAVQVLLHQLQDLQ
jgi:hypothetical protein